VGVRETLRYWKALESFGRFEKGRESSRRIEKFLGGLVVTASVRDHVVIASVRDHVVIASVRDHAITWLSYSLTLH